MKIALTFFAAILITATIWAQSPEKMSYQAVIRDASDNLVASQSVGMQISILQGTADGTAVYVETQTQSTNANGLVTIEIGDGTIISGSFSIIDWSAGPYFIKSETDPTGGSSYSITGISQLLSVPFALHAKSAENYNEIDGSITNEIQTLSISNDTIFLSNGGFVKLPKENTNVKHYIGELFGGGIVYYVDQTGEHGLIASLDDIDSGSGLEWSNINDVEIGISAQNYYNGIYNTAAIITQSGHTNSAAKLSDDYSNDGFSDWYLPSLSELELLNLVKYRINNILSNDGNVLSNPLRIENQRYWSSTEVNSNEAGYIGFIGYNTSTIGKSNIYKVRAIRVF